MPRAVLRALNQTRNTTLCERLETAVGLTGRTLGLIGRSQLSPGSGLLFQRHRFEPFMWMHTLGLRFPIDLIFLDHKCVVLRIVHGLRPWRFSPIVLKASVTLELAAGAAVRSATHRGDHIAFLGE